jgi:O-antigen/teichoic acid export membrane protein
MAAADATGAAGSRFADTVDTVPPERTYSPPAGSAARSGSPNRPRAEAPGGEAEARRSLTGHWRLARHMVGRLSWGLGDQAVSSLTNALMSVYIAHTLGAVQFGVFGLAYLTYVFVLNASRGLSTDPLMVRFSGASLPIWRRAVRDCTGTALCVGLVAGSFVLGVAILLPEATRHAFIALGLTLPGLMLQDSWRYSFFALGRGSRAFFNDVAWALTLAPTMLLLRAFGHINVFYAVLAWGGSGTVAAAIGPLQAHVIPKLSHAVSWLSETRDLGLRYLAEGVSGSLANQLRTYGLGLMLGLAAVGYVQACVTLVGPMLIVFVGISLVLIPEAARVLRRSPQRLLLFCLLTSVGLATAGLAYGIVALIALPAGIGNLLLGAIWRPTYPLLVPTIIGVVGQGMAIGAGAGLHALGASRRSLRASYISAMTLAAFSLAGTAVWGAEGFVCGTAVSIWCGVLVTWWQLHRALRDANIKSGKSAAVVQPSGRKPPRKVVR